jgi:hypothetical protein
MSIESFKKRHKIANIYRYSEVKGLGGSIEFGWVRADDLDFEKKVVISYPSKSKKFSEDDLSWSKDEGVSAVPYDDYSIYFKSLMSMSHETFSSTLHKNPDLAKELFLERYPSAGLKDYDYVVSISKLLTDGDRVIVHGRIFKVLENNS